MLRDSLINPSRPWPPSALPSPAQVHESAWGMLCLYCNCIKVREKDGLITLSKWPVHLERRVKTSHNGAFARPLWEYCSRATSSCSPLQTALGGFRWLKGGFDVGLFFMGSLARRIDMSIGSVSICKAGGWPAHSELLICMGLRLKPLAVKTEHYHKGRLMFLCWWYGGPPWGVGLLW